VRSRAERVEGDSQTLGQSFALIYPGLFFFTVVLKYEVPALRVELIYAQVEARRSALFLLRRISIGERERAGRLFDIFMENILRDPIEVKSRIAHVGLSHLKSLSGHTVYRLISQFFSDRASATREDPDELESYLLVFLTGALAVRIEPGQEIVECFLG
jgi:hypothetical protein